MRVAIIEDGIVVNIVMAEELLANYVETDHANIGDNYDGVVFSTPAMYPVVTVSELFAKNQLDKTAEIKEAVGIAVISGITHEALGQPHFYPTTRDDQHNLNGLVTESLLPDSGDEYKFWCADVEGVWARRIHTKLQIWSVGKAVLGHVKTQQEKYEQKLTEIAGSDPSSIGLIVW
ncbi:DUF4376 domain-containing protein [Methylobacter tundripaludum]|uniref:DUF4376 domain-containing protein n=1 Tax=Methylobacter tundripaludum TaxID=173365 RepID=UPI00068DD5D5|nr:hypothetical protein [Methylobacter tundripaludum]